MYGAQERELEYQALRQFLKAVDNQQTRVAANISSALDEELTDRQRQMVTLYYIKQMRMQDIAQQLGVNVSTVSRTIERGKKRLRRCLKYGGSALLAAAIDED